MSESVVLTLTKARIERGECTLERYIAEALSLPQSMVNVLAEEEDCATIIVFPENDDTSLDADAIARKLNGAIQRGEAEAWAAGQDATCEIADDEESVSIEEEEALEMWREMTEETRTGHLDKVANPDGIMIQPTNEAKCDTTTTDNVASPTESQLKRDPTLLEYDNVKRVDVSQIHSISWKEPIIITNAIQDDNFANRGMLDKHRLASIHGEVEVRTGNRETLIDNGITNSKPMPLSEALFIPKSGDESSLGCGRIVFSPVKELPDEFADEVKQFTACFPCCTESPMKKFTLTLASEGFGIGIHKHKAAMFMLLAGQKKWYMSSSKDLDGDTETHPGFYREKSSHKCIQQQGEVLFVPNDWYHEIFNLEYTAGIQALPE
mmetsp:Transcript_14598/g.31770  ORF Transcript_14598/g.31770 Transcript_14598/m.31770 type:complete len:380 (-) Transcript_14598:246-1385(-)